jgi:uridine phosphorylase
MKKIAPSELILNPDGSIYHLNLKPEHISDTILVVGNPGRVPAISKHFDQIEHQIEKREFVTHTGTYKDKRLTVLSTGIGADNIDIVVNELDALVNIDLKKRTPKTKFTSLTFIRIGTSGALQPKIPVDEFVVGRYGMGLDNLMNYYDYEFSENEQALMQAMQEHLQSTELPLTPYFIEGDSTLAQKLGQDCHTGITVTAPGFYAPQGRKLRGELAAPQLNDLLRDFEHNQLKITNFEMETSALYGLSRLLGHKACTACVVIANRAAKQFSADPKKAVNNLIRYVLDAITND